MTILALVVAVFGTPSKQLPHKIEILITKKDTICIVSLLEPIVEVQLDCLHGSCYKVIIFNEKKKALIEIYSLSNERANNTHTKEIDDLTIRFVTKGLFVEQNHKVIIKKALFHE